MPSTATITLGWGGTTLFLTALFLTQAVLLILGTLWLGRRARRWGRRREVLVAGAIISLLPLALIGMMYLYLYYRDF